MLNFLPESKIFCLIEYNICVVCFDFGAKNIWKAYKGQACYYG